MLSYYPCTSFLHCFLGAWHLSTNICSLMSGVIMIEKKEIFIDGKILPKMEIHSNLRMELLIRQK